MYERFTDRARKVMQLANEEAHRVHHEYVGTEHILLGLVKHGAGVAAEALKNLDVDLQRVRREVERIILTGPGWGEMPPGQKLPQTPRAKKVIEYSIEEARNLNHNYVGTEHLLLGLLREQEGVAAQVLMNLGVTMERLRAEVETLLGLRESELDVPPARVVPPQVPEPPLPPDVREVVDDLARRIDDLTRQKEDAVAGHDFDRAALLRDRAANLMRAKRAILRAWQADPPGEPGAATAPGM